LKHEISREPTAIPPDLFVQTANRHAIELGQVGSEHHAQPSQHDDAALNDALGWHSRATGEFRGHFTHLLQPSSCEFDLLVILSTGLDRL
jgi:hypothetical protein